MLTNINSCIIPIINELYSKEKLKSKYIQGLDILMRQFINKTDFKYDSRVLTFFGLENPYFLVKNVILAKSYYKI